MPTLHEMYEAAEVFCERYLVDDEDTVDEAALAFFFDDVHASYSPTLVYTFGRWQRHIAAGEIRHLLRYETPVPRATLAVADALLRARRIHMRAPRRRVREWHGLTPADLRAVTRLPDLRNALLGAMEPQDMLRISPRTALLVAKEPWRMLHVSPHARGWHGLREAVLRAQRRAPVIIPEGLQSLLDGYSDDDEDES